MNARALVIAGAVGFGVIIMGRKARAATTTDFDTLFVNTAVRFQLNWRLLKAIAMQESALDARAYNAETFAPPPGKPRLGKSIPPGADVEGYQGSFGIGQVYHTNSYSTARVLRPGGAYPAELLNPTVNIDIMGRLVHQLVGKGYSLATIDVYNVGETKYRQGVRNPAYQRAVQRYYISIGGVV